MKLSRSLMCIVFLCLQQESFPLHVSNTLKRSTTPDCRMVLTHNLECPSIGSYPVAGTCDHFARCIQTSNGVESQVEFCPVGEVYVTYRCQRSDDLNDCPQRYCSLKNKDGLPPPKTIFPDDATTIKSTTTTQKASKPRFTTRKPILETLHPSKSDAGNLCISLFPVFLLTTYMIL